MINVAATSQAVGDRVSISVRRRRPSRVEEINADGPDQG